MTNVTNIKKNGADLALSILGVSRLPKTFSLSDSSLAIPKMAYQDGAPTEEITGYSITVHLQGIGEIDVKILNYENLNALEELKQIELNNLVASDINGNVYFRADSFNVVGGEK